MMVVGAVRLLKTNRRTSANQVAAAISKSKRFDLFYFTQLTFHQTEHFKMFYNVLELPTSKRPPHKTKRTPRRSDASHVGRRGMRGHLLLPERGGPT
jgi:hypothetical protein